MSSDVESQTVTGDASQTGSLDVEKRAGQESFSSRSTNKREEESAGDSIGSISPSIVAPPHEIPNGGFVAWLQCANAFFLFFNSWGIVNTYGVYQTFYQQDILSTKSPSQISWIGSIQAFLLILLGTFSGPLFDRGYLRALVITGAFAGVLGMMMTSLCTEYWQLVLAQGLVTGIGAGAMFLPSITIIPMYFTTRKALAQGIAATGSSFGGIIYPIMFHKLQPRIGFGWTTRAIAFVMFVTLIPCLLTIKRPARAATQRKLWDTSSWKSWPYPLFVAGMTFGFIGLYIPFFYVQVFALERGIANGNLGFYLLAILNAGSVFGRTVPNHVADKIGPFNVLIPCALITAILPFTWMSIHSTAGIIIFCVLYGSFSGSFISLTPTIVFTLSPSPALIGVRMGMLLFPASVAILVGNPIAGAILKSGWIGLEAFCGAMILLSLIFMTAARIASTGWVLRVRA